MNEMKNFLILLLNKLFSIREAIKFNELQIPFKEFYSLKKDKGNKRSSVLFGNSIKITDAFWFLHSLKEIYIERVYKFKSKENNPVIIDCGSNIGLSIIFFKKLYPDAQIIGFEPDSDIFKILQFNLSQFNLYDVKIFPRAVWINESPLLFKQNGSVGGHLIDIEENNTIKVETARLKDFLNQRIDFLKIDVEGAEFEILKDCKDKLVNVQNIFVEYHSFHENPQMIGELLIILKNAGFKVYIKEAWENMHNPFIEKNGPYFDLQLNIFGYRRD
jgi:FkbM family methyltransferase